MVLFGQSNAVGSSWTDWQKSALLELSRPRRSHHWQGGAESRVTRDGWINEKPTLAGCPPARMVTESHRNYRHHPKVLKFDSHINFVYFILTWNFLSALPQRKKVESVSEKNLTRHSFSITVASANFFILIKKEGNFNIFILYEIIQRYIYFFK